MTLSELRSYTRYLTSTDTTTFSDADSLVSINAHYNFVVGEILEAMDDWEFSAETATTSLVAGQQEYSLPTDIIKLKRVEVSFDGSTWSNVGHFDINERGYATDTTSIARDFDSTDPYFDLMDNSLVLYPIPSSNVSDGLKIWYSKNVTALSAAGDSPSFASAYHKILAYGAAKDYLERNLEAPGSANKLAQAEKNYYEGIDRLKALYRKRNQDRPYVVMPNYVNYDYGNE